MSIKSKVESMENTGAKKAIKLAGGYSAVARKMGISRAAVHQWASRGVPATRVRSLSALVAQAAANAVQVSPEEIRPDIFG